MNIKSKHLIKMIHKELSDMLKESAWSPDGDPDEEKRPREWWQKDTSSTQGCQGWESNALGITQHDGNDTKCKDYGDYLIDNLWLCKRHALKLCKKRYPKVNSNNIADFAREQAAGLKKWHTDAEKMLVQRARDIKRSNNALYDIYESRSNMKITRRNLLFKISTLLLREGVKERMKKTYGPKYNALLDRLSAADPSKENKYLDWMARQIIDLGEPELEVTALVPVFHSSKQLMPADDIDRYPTMDDLGKKLTLVRKQWDTMMKGPEKEKSFNRRDMLKMGAGGVAAGGIAGAALGVGGHAAADIFFAGDTQKIGSSHTTQPKMTMTLLDGTKISLVAIEKALTKCTALVAKVLKPGIELSPDDMQSIIVSSGITASLPDMPTENCMYSGWDEAFAFAIYTFVIGAEYNLVKAALDAFEVIPGIGSGAENTHDVFESNPDGGKIIAGKDIKNVALLAGNIEIAAENIFKNIDMNVVVFNDSYQEIKAEFLKCINLAQDAIEKNGEAHEMTMGPIFEKAGIGSNLPDVSGMSFYDEHRSMSCDRWDEVFSYALNMLGPNPDGFDGPAHNIDVFTNDGVLGAGKDFYRPALLNDIIDQITAKLMIWHRSE